MIVLDISMVVTGLPRIAQTMSITPVQLSWVQTAYTLTFGGLLLAGARAGDLFGRRRMFVTGLVIFTLASIAIGLSITAVMLIVARAVQGAGAAILAPATLALLSVHFPEGPERTRALSWYGATAGIGASIGLVVGGIFADLASWRVGFFINVPIGFLLAWAAFRYVRETPSQSGYLDIAGAGLSTAGIVSIVYGLVEAAEAGFEKASGGYQGKAAGARGRVVKPECLRAAHTPGQSGTPRPPRIR